MNTDPQTSQQETRHLARVSERLWQESMRMLREEECWQHHVAHPCCDPLSLSPSVSAHSTRLDLLSAQATDCCSGMKREWREERKKADPTCCAVLGESLYLCLRPLRALSLSLPPLACLHSLSSPLMSVVGRALTHIHICLCIPRGERENQSQRQKSRQSSRKAGCFKRAESANIITLLIS